MNGDVGPDYTLLLSTALTTNSWTNLFITYLNASPLIFTNSFPAGSSHRFYRVLLGPQARSSRRRRYSSSNTVPHRSGWAVVPEFLELGQ